MTIDDDHNSNNSIQLLRCHNMVKVTIIASILFCYVLLVWQNWLCSVHFCHAVESQEIVTFRVDFVSYRIFEVLERDVYRCNDTGDAYETRNGGKSSGWRGYVGRHLDAVCYWSLHPVVADCASACSLIPHCYTNDYEGTILIPHSYEYNVKFWILPNPEI